MFTGIITDIGTVRSVANGDKSRIAVTTGFDPATIPLGASIACSGPCLTVVDKGEDWFAVDVSQETLSRTTLKDWRQGTLVNLERSLKVGDELGGHIITGHVDGVGRVVGVVPDGASLRLRIAVPEALAPFIASKGSIAVDGISLTVNEVEDAVFGVNIIPHTREETTLGRAKEGQGVNIEIDILARYIARLSHWNNHAS